MNLKEELQQYLESDDRGVIDHFERFGVIPVIPVGCVGGVVVAGVSDAGLTTPGSERKSSWAPQKQPLARITLEVGIVFSLFAAGNTPLRVTIRSGVLSRWPGCAA